MVTFVVIAILIWVVSLGAWYVVTNYLRKSDVDRVRGRLLGTAKTKSGKASSTVSAPLIQGMEQQKGKVIVGLLKRYNLHQSVQAWLEQSGLRWSVGAFGHACLTLFLLGFVIGWYMLPGRVQWAAFMPALLMGGAPAFHVWRTRRARLRRFEEQFPESLEFVARSMRAGHAFSVSLEMIHREFEEPLSSEFKRAFDEHNLGLPLDVALEKLGKRVPLLDVHFFVSAVLLQKRTGGNLAEILDKLAYVIRERFKLRGKIRAISAHGRMTGTALSIIPMAVGFIMFYVNPDHMRFFFLEELGNLMLGAALGLQLLGFLIIKKIVTIEV